MYGDDRTRGCAPCSKQPRRASAPVWVTTILIPDDRREAGHFRGRVGSVAWAAACPAIAAARVSQANRLGVRCDRHQHDRHQRQKPPTRGPQARTAGGQEGESALTRLAALLLVSRQLREMQEREGHHRGGPPARPLTPSRAVGCPPEARSQGRSKAAEKVRLAALFHHFSWHRGPGCLAGLMGRPRVSVRPQFYYPTCYPWKVVTEA